MDNMLFIGNHGTNKINISSILKHGFVPSSGEGHWYGRGVYFFIDGINCTSIDKLAEQWAKDQSYNKKTKKLDYCKYAIIEAEILTEKNAIVDLRIDEYAKKVNIVREKVKSLCMCNGRKMSDDEIWEYMKKKFDIKVVVDNTYIKFGDERIKQITSRINNCTILSVLDKDIIDKNSIKIIRTGDI